MSDLAQQVARLGIKGSENVSQFTEAMAKLASVSALSGPEAAAAVARISQQFELDIVENADRVSSVLVDMANNANTTEGEILTLTRKFGTYAHALGLTTEQSMALSTATLAMGATTHIAGTGFKVIFDRLAKSRKEAAKFVGMTQEQWEILLNTEPHEAFMVFLRKFF